MRSKIEIEFAKILEKNTQCKFITNDKSLPGTPDVVFHDNKLIVFFNGCYWHSHHCRSSKHSHQWNALLNDIRNRDLVSISKLQQLGYETLIVWECEWRDNSQKILDRINGRLHFARHQEVTDKRRPIIHRH